MNQSKLPELMHILREQIGRAELAEILGIRPNQLTDVIGGRISLPFTAALRVAQIVDVDPITILCSNEAITEKDPAKLEYLNSMILPLDLSHNLRLRRLLPKSESDSYSNLGDCQQELKRFVLQGANPDRVPWPKEPRNPEGHTIVRSPWALRPIPRWISNLDFLNL